MALLQISEPGQAPDPHQRRIAVGIDLGTTHSLVASVRSGVAECLPDAQGRVILPSVVRYVDAQKRQIGFDALAAQVDDPVNTISSVKRLMGRGMDDIGNRAALPYQLNDKPGMVTLQTVAGEKSPVEVSAEPSDARWMLSARGGRPTVNSRSRTPLRNNCHFVPS